MCAQLLLSFQPGGDAMSFCSKSGQHSSLTHLNCFRFLMRAERLAPLLPLFAWSWSPAGWTFFKCFFDHLSFLFCDLSFHIFKYFKLFASFYHQSLFIIFLPYNFCLILILFLLHSLWLFLPSFNPIHSYQIKHPTTVLWFLFVLL